MSLPRASHSTDGVSLPLDKVSGDTEGWIYSQRGRSLKSMGLKREVLISRMFPVSAL